MDFNNLPGATASGFFSANVPLNVTMGAESYGDVGTIIFEHCTKLSADSLSENSKMANAIFFIFGYMLFKKNEPIGSFFFPALSRRFIRLLQAD